MRDGVGKEVGRSAVCVKGEWQSRKAQVSGNGGWYLCPLAFSPCLQQPRSHTRISNFCRTLPPLVDVDGGINKKKILSNLFPSVSSLSQGRKMFSLDFSLGSNSSPPSRLWPLSQHHLYAHLHMQWQRMRETLTSRRGWWVGDGFFCVFVCLRVCAQFPQTALTTDSDNPVWPLIRRFCSIQICPTHRRSPHFFQSLWLTGRPQTPHNYQ